MQGIIGAFQHLDSAVEAVEELKKSRMGDVTVFTPTPRHELEEALHAPPSQVRKFTLVGGILGVTFGYWISIWTSEYWPLVTGGKAIGTWIPFTIIGFELFVLIGGLSTVFGMFYVSRIPRLTMTVGYDPRFSHGDFGVWVECPPDKLAAAEELMRRHGAVEVRGER
jgi:hypothetical protein